MSQIKCEALANQLAVHIGGEVCEASASDLMEILKRQIGLGFGEGQP
jgi:hypothetical protein